MPLPTSYSATSRGSGTRNILRRFRFVSMVGLVLLIIFFSTSIFLHRKGGINRLFTFHKKASLSGKWNIGTRRYASSLQSIPGLSRSSNPSNNGDKTSLRTTTSSSSTMGTTPQSTSDSSSVSRDLVYLSTSSTGWEGYRIPNVNVVPNIVHFIFGLDPNFGHLKFGMIHYLAILGAHLHVQPDEIRLHYLYEPTGEWWNCTKPMVKLVKENDITEVYGKPMKMKVAHKADIIRMRILREEGGIYLDSDVIALRSFEELRKYDLSMGLEGEEGLCNAVLIGAPNTSFINRWWDEYRTFDAEKQWAYHSVLVPRQLQRKYPTEVIVLSDRAFFTPMWTQLRTMYDTDDGYDYHANFAVHLWTSADERQRNRLGKLTPEDIFTGEGSFHRRMRIFLADAYDKGKLCPLIHERTGKLIKLANGNYTLPLHMDPSDTTAI